MPEISIVFFRDDNNTVPVLDWIVSLESKAQTNLAHGIVKESQVPSQEIERAIERKIKFQQNPDRYTNQGEV